MQKKNTFRVLAASTVLAFLLTAGLVVSAEQPEDPADDGGTSIETPVIDGGNKDEETTPTNEVLPPEDAGDAYSGEESTVSTTETRADEATGTQNVDEPQAGDDLADNAGHTESEIASGSDTPADIRNAANTDAKTENVVRESGKTAGTQHNSMADVTDASLVAGDYESLLAALAAAGTTPSEITIAGDIALPAMLPIAKGADITFVDNGEDHSFYKDPDTNWSGSCIEVAAGGTLTIRETAAGSLTFYGSNANGMGQYIGTVKIYGALVLEGGTFTGTYHGGGMSGTLLAIGTEASLVMTGGMVTGNTFTNQYSGAVNIQDGAYFFLDGGSIMDNTNSIYNVNSAGGVILYTSRQGGSSFVMESGTISGNTGYTGGVMLYTDRNTGTLGGQEGYAPNEFTFRGGVITSNTGLQGGGIFAVCQSSVSVEGGQITGNTAAFGGGISMYSAYDEFNTQYPGYATTEEWSEWVPVRFSMTGGSIDSNHAVVDYGYNGKEYGGVGGGVFLATQLASIDGGSITGNDAELMGGGLYIIDGRMVMQDNLVAYNNAGTSGGGIYVNYNSGLYVGVNNEGTVITRNSALDGGGIYNMGFTDIEEAAITSNMAANDGGGIWTHSYPALTTVRAVFSGNTAENGAYVFDEDDEETDFHHASQVVETLSLSLPFHIEAEQTAMQRAYNNYDINYTGGTLYIIVDPDPTPDPDPEPLPVPIPPPAPTPAPGGAPGGAEDPTMVEETIRIVTQDGEVIETMVWVVAPVTGDNGSPILWYSLVAASALCLPVLAFAIKHTQRTKSDFR